MKCARPLCGLNRPLDRKLAGWMIAAGLLFLLPYLVCGPHPRLETFSFAVDTAAAGGHTVVTLLRNGPQPIVAKIAPDAGANLFSLEFAGVQLLESPAALDSFDGSSRGVPVLYPTPCRVPEGRFTFAGREFNFVRNRDGNHIHGLVRDVPWQWERPSADSSGVRLHTWIDFAPGTDRYRQFGIDHRLELEYVVDREGVRIEYRVANRDSTSLPFGLGFHAYWNYPGDRREVWLTVPADRRMLMEDLIPTGGLAPVAGTQYDLTSPVRVANLAVDDVWYGLTPASPAVVEWRDSGVRLTLAASREFGHLIVYDLPQNDFFCVENLTASPDAHNLYAKGFEKESGLIVVPPGGESRGWVRYGLVTIEN